MAEKDLFIGLDEIRVSYVFRNLTSADVTGEVNFPLPPISLAHLNNPGWNLHEDLTTENLAGLAVTVGGTDRPVSIDRIAGIERPWDEPAPLARQYGAPGRDVTATLAQYDILMTLEYVAVGEALLALDPTQQAEVQAKGLAEFIPITNPSWDDVLPLWSTVLRFHWTQTFPASAETRISHRYDNIQSPCGLYSWEDPPVDWQLAEVDRFCIDPGTANGWAGPIGKFRLTLDKGAAENVISLCADGVRETGPTTFVIE